jgi:DNA-binding CsgD family transcriptional regulator
MFSNVTIRALSDALLQLHRPGKRNDFPSRLFACLNACLSGDFYSYDERMENHSQRIELYPASAVDVDVLSGWIDQRPDIRGVYKHSGPPSMMRFWAPLRRCSSELHDELLALLGQRHLLRVVFFDERSQVNVVVSRSTRSFSDHERQLLETLRPHLVQAYKSSNQSSFSSEAMGVADVGFLVADRNGNIHYATAKARKLMRHYFHPKSEVMLPDRVQTWLKEGEELNRVPPLRELRIDFGHISLIVQTMSTTDAPLYRLLLHETVQKLEAESLQKLGLTRREAEVLFWTSQGKSNGDIAIILASKVRTIAKHLERIFAKLMVENRTAAAQAALATVDCFHANRISDSGPRRVLGDNIPRLH